MLGRTDVLRFAWGLIMERLLIDYGFNSFETYATSLWVGPSSDSTETYNNFLAILYSTGLFGAISFLTAMSILLYQYVVTPSSPRDLFVINILLSSLSETDVFTSFTPEPIIVFLIFLALNVRRPLDHFLSVREEGRPS